MIHLVYANRSNAGDWLSARAIRSLLRPARVEEHLCDEPFVPATLQRLAAAPPGELVVIGGGGLLMDYFEPFWRGLLQLSPRRRFCIWGAGVCSWKRAPSQLDPALLGEIARSSLLSVVRDELTRSALASAGRVHVPDPVPCPSLTTVVPRDRSGSAGAGGAVLHVDHYDLVGAEAHARIDGIVRLFAAQTERGVLGTNNRLPPGDEAALQRILELYGTADLVVTSRLHGAVLGLGSGCRVIAVSGDAKIDSFMQWAGLSDWLLDPAELDALAERLGRVHEQVLPRHLLGAARWSHAQIAAQILLLAA